VGAEAEAKIDDGRAKPAGARVRFRPRSLLRDRTILGRRTWFVDFGRSPLSRSFAELLAGRRGRYDRSGRSDGRVLALGLVDLDGVFGRSGRLARRLRGADGHVPDREGDESMRREGRDERSRGSRRRGGAPPCRSCHGEFVPRIAPAGNAVRPVMGSRRP
jgi:hypothetical protein